MKKHGKTILCLLLALLFASGAAFAAGCGQAREKTSPPTAKSPTPTPTPTPPTPTPTPTPPTPTPPDPGPELNEEFYGSVKPDLKVEMVYEDPAGSSIAGALTVEAASGDAYGNYYFYYGDENGVLPGTGPIKQFRVRSKNGPLTVIETGFQNACPPGARTIIASDKKGTTAYAYFVIPSNKLTAGEKISSIAVMSDVHIFINEHYNGDYNSINGDEDTKRAIGFLNEMDIEQISITGDLILSFTSVRKEIEAELEKSTSILKTAKVPVYVVKGNHDKMVDEAVWTEMTGCEMDYSFEKDGTVYIYMSLLKQNDTGSNDTYPYGSAKVAWLKERLTEAKGKRVLLFMHYPFNGYAGLQPGKTYGFTEGSSEEKAILDAIAAHGAVTVFNGHTHYDFETVEKYPDICVARIGGKNTWTVHSPSVAYPRDKDGYEISSESECYIVDLYKDGLLLRGLDLVTGLFEPAAVWYLDTRELPNGFAEQSYTVFEGSETKLEPLNSFSSASFKSLDPTVATVDAAGSVKALAAGNTHIVATVDGYTYVLSLTVRKDPAMKGTGTQDDPFIISNADQFVFFQEEIKGGKTYKGQYLRITSDIDLNECADYAPFTEDTGGDFAGTLDGCGHIVKVKTEKSEASFAVPYFWNISGVILNVCFDCEMGGCASTSYIAGRTMNKGTMVNCLFTGSMRASNVNTTVVCGTSSGAVLQNLYINVTVSGTTPGKSESGISMKGSGKVANVYYIANGCTPQFKETEVSSGEGVAEKLNASLEASASAAGVDAALLCAWEEVNGVPVLVKK